MSGIIDFDCDECNETFNGTFTLALARLCVWETAATVTNLCDFVGTTPIWRLTCEPLNDRWVLTSADVAPGSINPAVYVKETLSLWNCLGPTNVMTLLTPTDHCDNWPAAVTLAAA